MNVNVSNVSPLILTEQEMPLNFSAGLQTESYEDYIKYCRRLSFDLRNYDAFDFDSVLEELNEILLTDGSLPEYAAFLDYVICSS